MQHCKKMTTLQTYFIALKYGQDENLWEVVSSEIENTPGVLPVAEGSGIREVQLTDETLAQVRQRFGELCDIEAPIKFEPE